MFQWSKSHTLVDFLSQYWFAALFIFFVHHVENLPINDFFLFCLMKIKSARNILTISIFRIFVDSKLRSICENIRLIWSNCVCTMKMSDRKYWILLSLTIWVFLYFSEILEEKKFSNFCLVFFSLFRKWWVFEWRLAWSWLKVYNTVWISHQVMKMKRSSMLYRSKR